MDLLSALVHEFGHAAGFGHDNHGLMSETLAAGTRVVPNLKPWRYVAPSQGEASDAGYQAPIDWTLPSVRITSPSPRDLAQTQPNSERDAWKGRFVNELGAPEWSASPNSRIQIQLPKVGSGRAL